MTILVDGLAALLTWIVVALAPLALAAVDGRDRNGNRGATIRLARSLIIPVGAMAAFGLWLPAGSWAALLTMPYALVTMLLGGHGLARLLLRGPRDASQLATGAGLLLWPGAAAWLLAHRAGYALLGYPPLWVGLTAAHFHVAGVMLPIVIGRATHARGAIAGSIAIACVLGVPLTAAGIAGSRAFETTAAVFMAGSGIIAGATMIATRGRWFRFAGLALIASMTLAMLYATRAVSTPIVIGDLDPLSSMLVIHGSLNAVAFATAGLVAVIVAGPLAGHDRPPLSRFAGGWHIGPGFDVGRSDAKPRGLVDSLADLGHAGLDANRVAPKIRAFYERTAQHRLVVAPHWRFGFRTGARLWQRIARRVGQLELPTRAETGYEGLTSRITAIDATRDGRTTPRAWIRQFLDERAMYVAIYATHHHEGRAYMNIAFPLPGGNLASVLRMDHLGNGVRVSTRGGGDAGIWFVARVIGRWVPIRLPLAEWIDVWTVDDPAAPQDLVAWAPSGFTTVARHRLWLFGIAYLTLDYAMKPHGDGDGAVDGGIMPTT